MDEGLASSKRLFEICQRETRIDRKKGSSRISGFNARIGSAGLCESIAEGRQQRLRLAAIGKTDCAFSAGQLSQFSGLLQVTLQ